MGTGLQPNSDYTRTWSRSGEIEYATLADGTRLRYLKTGSGPTALILLHTVRTQLDHFQFVIPRILGSFTVYAIDLPGMGWSDITAGKAAKLEQPRVQTLQLWLRQRIKIHTPSLRLPARALQPPQKNLGRTRIGDRPLAQTTLDLCVTRGLTNTTGCAGRGACLSR